MYCSDCGKEIRDNAKFCPYCGTTVAANAETEKAGSAENIVREEPAEKAEIADEIVPDTNNMQETAIDETHTAEKMNDENSALAEKFHEKDGLFIVKEQTSSVEAPVSEVSEKKKLPWGRISIAAVCVAVIGTAVYFVPTAVVPAMEYSGAQKLYENGDFNAASIAFAKLGEYKDSADYIMKCRYGEAEQLFADGKYPEAADAFSALNSYSDSDVRAMECMLAIAEEYIASGDYDSAMSVYAAAGKTDLAEQTALQKIEALAAEGEYFKAAEIAENYCSEDVVTEYLYQGAASAKNSGDFKTAADTFYRLGQYKDSANHAVDCTYSFYMNEYTEKGASEEIVRGFYFLGDFRNARDMFIDTSYEYGLECEKNGDFATSVAMFRNCGNYKAAMGELYKSRYNLGKSLLDTDPASARSIFALLSTYADSAAQKKNAAARLPDNHEDWYADGFTSTSGYYTSVFRNTDTLIISCTAGTDTISAPITLTLTLRGSDGNEVSADCENVRNSGSFNGSFSLTETASGNAEIIIARKDNGAVLRTIDIMITE